MSTTLATHMQNRQDAILALILVGMIPTVSILVSFGTDGGLFSQISFVLFKICLLLIPLYWHLKRDRNEWSWSKPENGGYSMAIGLGIGLSAIMLIVWFFVKDLLDYNILRDAVEPVGLLDWKLYVLGCMYWIFLNSLLEEYVFRWFLVVKSEIICSGEKYAIVLSAMIFVVHHSIALYFFGFPWWANLLASIGLFIGGAIFSWLYIRYRSIWIPYITHAICDVTVFGIGALMLF